MTGEATAAQIGGFLVALRAKGETPDEIAGCAEAMRAHVLSVKPRRDDLVDTAGTGGDGARTINISTGSCACRRGRRRRRCEARQPRCLVGLRVGRRTRGARLRARTGAAAHRRLDRRARLRLSVRARAPSRDATCGTGAQGARDANGLQRPRPADEPGRRAGAGGRRVFRAPCADDRRGARPARRPARVRRPRRGRNRRALAGRPEPRGRGRRRRGARANARPRGRARRAAQQRRRAPRRNAVRECCSAPPGVRGRDGGRRSAILLNAAGAIAAAGHAENLRDGLELARETVDSGAALDRLEQLVAFSRQTVAT